jgi:hypothetical protein
VIENWKDIPGYEGRYQVSDQGRVRSLDHRVRCTDKRGVERTRVSPGRVLRPGLCREYRIVNLAGAGTVAVHLLVARSWVEGYEVGLEVNHKDGVKANCSAGNLEWVSKTANQNHAVDLQLNTQAVRVRDPATGRVWPSIARAAKETGISKPRITATWERAA